MTQSTPPSDDAFKDSLSFVKKLWGGMGVPGMGVPGTSTPGMPVMPGMSMPTMSVEELDKRIQELKSVEAWLNVNISMLHNTIQALEIQRATIATLHSLSSTMAQTMQGASSESGDEKKDGTASSAISPDISPLVSQSAVWWNAVQEQFKQALGVALEKSAANVEAAKSMTENVKTTATTASTKAAAKAGTKAGTKRTTRSK